MWTHQTHFKSTTQSSNFCSGGTLTFLSNFKTKPSNVTFTIIMSLPAVQLPPAMTCSHTNICRHRKRESQGMTSDSRSFYSCTTKQWPNHSPLAPISYALNQMLQCGMLSHFECIIRSLCMNMFIQMEWMLINKIKTTEHRGQVVSKPSY